jgi:di/tricarboxylate transporter
MSESGLAAAIAITLLRAGGDNPWVVLFVVYGMTMLFTELITNNAAAVLVFPIAMETARTLGASPMPFVVSVMVAASAGFATPFGYQTNLMVYGPGGYRYTDYLRLGLPLNLIIWALCAGLAPLIWPFS